MFNTNGNSAMISGMSFQDASMVIYAPGTQYPTKTLRQKARVIWKALRGQTLHFNQPLEINYTQMVGSAPGFASLSLFNEEPPCA